MNILRSNRTLGLRVMPRQGYNFMQACRCFPNALTTMGVLLIALVFLSVQAETVRAETTPDTASYIVTFTGNWDEKSVPGAEDEELPWPHFSSLVGAVHNSDVILWKRGEKASPGVKALAEGGKTAELEKVIKAAGDDVKGDPIVEKQSDNNPGEVREGGINAKGTVVFEIEVSKTHPLVTLLTMIAPSPDWFVGVNADNLSLMEEDGTWKSTESVNLFAYDAGTEEGDMFSLENDATDPQGVITSLKEDDNFSDTDPVAKLEFTLKAPAMPATPAAPATTSKKDDDGCALASEGSDKNGVFNLLLVVFGVFSIVLLRKRFTESKTY